jgi:hypothetical protein
MVVSGMSSYLMVLKGRRWIKVSDGTSVGVGWSETTCLGPK